MVNDNYFYEITIKRPFDEIEFYKRLREIHEYDSDYDFKILRDIVKLMCKSYPLKMGNVFHKVFFKLYCENKYLDILKILMILKSMDLSLIRSMGLNSIVIASLCYPVYQVQELALECIGEWGSTMYYTPLYSMKFEQEYLNDYKVEILEELKEKIEKKS